MSTNVVRLRRRAKSLSAQSVRVWKSIDTDMHRRRFFLAAAAVAPIVESLREDCGAAYVLGEAAELRRMEQFANLCAREGRLVEGGVPRTSEANDFDARIDSWATRWHLDAPWCQSLAVEVLSGAIAMFASLDSAAIRDEALRQIGVRGCYRGGERHYDWCARWRVLGQSKSQIARDAKVDRHTVQEGISKVENLCGFRAFARGCGISRARSLSSR